MGTSIFLSAPPTPFYLESGVTIYQPGEQHPNRRNIGVFDLLIIEKGCLFMGEESTEWALKEGETLLLLPNKYHYAVRPCEEETKFYWIHFQAATHWEETNDREFSQSSQEYTIQLKKNWSFPYPKQGFSLVDRLISTTQERHSDSFWMRQQLFNEMLQVMDIRQNRQDSDPALAVAEQAEFFIKTNYQRGITNQMLSDELHFHYNYITRCMKKVYGVTPMEYLLKFRLEQAKLLLLRTDWSIATISEKVGFENPPYFTRCFSREMKISPLRFRKNYTEETIS